ncbi:MAG: hypothetical protein PHX93_04585 [Candidatus Peribacteraceae bacterium]|jgi:hypothetical protein|nr:hypothetical protein [Candidatus Peribacteraceae bacterium]
MLWFIFPIGFALLSLGFVIWASLRRRTKIPHLHRVRLREAWNAAIALSDPSRRVLEAEKVCDAVLKALGYTGTFAEKLQQAGPRLTRLDDIWNAHRLRNRIAHEMNIRVSAAQSDRALKAFATIVHHFLR